MGNIWAVRLPIYLSKRNVRFELKDGWATRSRSSGGFDSVMGVAVHHDAGRRDLTVKGAEKWACYNSPDKPIGNGYLARDGVFHLWAAGAANTMGVGGPRLTSRGVIAKDNGNRTTFAIEAANDGIGETWTEAQCRAYPEIVAAVIEWANAETPGAALGAGDVWSHFEWTPGRKVDPRGPSRWATGELEMWNMDKFRSDVLLSLNPCPVVVTPPVGEPVIAPQFNPWDGDYSLWPLNGAKPSIARGSQGDAVAYAKAVFKNELYKVTYTLGHGEETIRIINLAKTNVFDAEFEKSVIDVQRIMGLTVDGKIGVAETWPLIDNISDGALF